MDGKLHHYEFRIEESFASWSSVISEKDKKVRKMSSRSYLCKEVITRKNNWIWLVLVNQILDFKPKWVLQFLSSCCSILVRSFGTWRHLGDISSPFVLMASMLQYKCRWRLVPQPLLVVPFLPCSIKIYCTYSSP